MLRARRRSAGRGCGRLYRARADRRVPQALPSAGADPSAQGPGRMPSRRSLSTRIRRGSACPRCWAPSSSIRPPCTQSVTVTFGVAHFGIGLPFTTTGIMTPTMVINIPPHRHGARQDDLDSAVQRPFLRADHSCNRPGTSRSRASATSTWASRCGWACRTRASSKSRNPMTEVVTITLALINHRPELAGDAHADAVDERGARRDARRSRSPSAAAALRRSSEREDSSRPGRRTAHRGCGSLHRTAS